MTMDGTAGRLPPPGVTVRPATEAELDLAGAAVADAYLAVVSGIERRFKVWTYDSEFRTTWRRADGTRIPLAVS